MRKRLGAVYVLRIRKSALRLLDLPQSNGRIAAFLQENFMAFSKQLLRHSRFSAFQFTQLITKLREGRGVHPTEWYLAGLNTANYDIETHSEPLHATSEGPHGPLPAVKTST